MNTPAALQNKGRSAVNYRQSSVFDRPYLSCNDHCDWLLFQEIFSFINITFISYKFFWLSSRKWTFYVIYLPCQFSWWSINFLKIDLPQLKLECLNCQKSDIRTNSPCCSVLLWTSFCFPQVNRQKRVWMVSTNNITCSEQIYKPF